MTDIRIHSETPPTQTSLQHDVKRATDDFQLQVNAQRLSEDRNKLLSKIAKDTSEISEKLDQKLDKN